MSATTEEENLVAGLVDSETESAGTGTTTTKRRAGGNIATLFFESPATKPATHLMASLRHKEIDVEPLLPFESAIMKVGPTFCDECMKFRPIVYTKANSEAEQKIHTEQTGHKGFSNGSVESHWGPKTFLERMKNGSYKEIAAQEVRTVQMLEGGGFEDVPKLQMTNTIEILENRPMEECTLVNEVGDIRKSLGTTIKQNDVYRYAPEAVHAAWAADDAQAKATYDISSYMFSQGTAFLFPFTHGKYSSIC